MPYSLSNYEDVFSLPYEQLSIDDYLESIRHKDIFRYRAKLVRAGDVLEVEIYPVWRENKAAEIRTKTGNPTRAVQKNLNRENTRKHVSRLVHANFTNKDIWCTFDYRHEHTPADAKDAQKDIQNYIRRLRGYIKKNGLPDLKYIYVTEWAVNEETGETYAHHHIIMNFRDRDIAEKFWTKGFRLQSRRLESDDYGLEGLARYIAKPETKRKNRKGQKTYANSTNLTQPDIVCSEYRLPGTNYRMSKKRAMELATNENVVRQVLEEYYSNHTIPAGGVKIKFSQYVSGAYIYARMMRKPTQRKRKERSSE